MRKRLDSSLLGNVEDLAFADISSFILNVYVFTIMFFHCQVGDVDEHESKNLIYNIGWNNLSYQIIYNHCSVCVSKIYSIFIHAYWNRKKNPI